MHEPAPRHAQATTIFLSSAAVPDRGRLLAVLAHEAVAVRNSLDRLEWPTIVTLQDGIDLGLQDSFFMRY